MNYFVEGLQGSGKSTLVRKLSEKHPECKTVMEGDCSPVELAWCARMSEDQYIEILKRWKDLSDQIETKSHKEGDYRIVCYTQVRSKNPDFYRQLEKYEIYNGRTTFEQYRDIVLTRYRNWKTDGNIFECSLLQNGVEDMILFRDMSDDAIMDFYKEVKSALDGKEYEIFYIETPDIEKNLNVIRKERKDEKGNELWYPMMLEYFNNSPHAKKHSLKDSEGLLKHLQHRQELELRICHELFSDRLTVLKSKEYDL